MPGIVGIVSAAPSDRLPEDLQRMLRAVQRGGQQTADWRDETAHPRAAFGWAGHEWHTVDRQMAAIDGSAIVLHGELHGVTLQGAADAQPSTSAAASLLAGYLRAGESYLAGLEGRFIAAIWDANCRRLVLFNDKFGTLPLYFHHGQGALYFAAEIKALLALPHVPRQLNQRGLAQFFTYGHFWNQDTLLESIECLDAATVVEWSPNTGALSRTPYWRPQPASRQTAAQSLEAIDAAFKAAVDDRSLDTAGLGVSLSGGLDARTILAVMDPSPVPPICVSMGMVGSLDRDSARQLAELAGADFHPFVLDERFLSDFAQHLGDMVELTDGHYLSQCIVMPTLPLYRQLGVRSLLRGHAGELMHMHKAYNFSIDSAAAQLQGETALENWLASRLQSHLLDGVPEPLLRGVETGGFESLARESLREGLAATSAWNDPVDRISQLFLDQRTRRETAMSLVKFGSVVDVRLPYLDGRVVDALFRSPPELRLGEAIQTHILRKRRPAFLKPLNSNNGAPVGASEWRKRWGYFKMRVLAKLGVQGYQPYERLGLWLRRELRPVVEETLLDHRCLDRGLLNPDAVRNVVRRNMEGQANHTYLLMAMLALESGFRRFLDDDSQPGAASPFKPSGLRKPALC